MPQPFPRHLDNPQFTIGHAATQRPDLFTRGMDVIAHHSQIDALLIAAMVHLLGTDPEPAMVMLAAINNNNIKQKAYIELARNRLNDEDVAIFEGVLAACTSADKERNRLAHDLWATEPQLPDSVVLINAREYSKIAARSHLLQDATDLSSEAPEALIRTIRASGLVYVSDDFVRIRRQMSETFFLVVALQNMLDQRTPEKEIARQRQQLRERLGIS